MNNNSSTSIPKLAPPGAGLPPIERFIANLMVHTQARRTTPAQAAATFAAEHSSIMETLRGRDPTLLSQPILIKRLPGLEDSSRHWSVFMVADHLRIVNQEIADVITALCAGRLPSRQASTAAVKPAPDVTASVIADFDQSCQHLAATAASQSDLNTALKYAHPWFGPMNAAKWYFMAAFHMRLHRKQIHRILATLP